MWLYFALPVTIGVFFISKYIYALKPIALLHPFLLTVIFFILIHVLGDLSYGQYSQGTSILTQLLEPAVVALAVPLFSARHLIKEKFKIIMLSCLLAVLIGFIFAFYLLPLLGANAQLAATLAPQSITTPIAVQVSASLKGIVSLTAAIVVFVGLFGATFGLPLLQLAGVKNKQAKGIAIGCASHVLGTAKALEGDQEIGAFSSLALIVCAILTAIFMPILYHLCIV
ncbi:LrgB family protein [Psychromonas sp. CNPT3]|uniref:LrgB family protein n=1 Tax=Psychromonas sp. CNPT3 TaxID=314282 RepID=UPI00006E34C8|nr:LrgB family protein [Psychromonas sp. CNPT3]AGH80736.1 LrgB family protein [Psychromonas sp. CNPT3]